MDPVDDPHLEARHAEARSSKLRWLSDCAVGRLSLRQIDSDHFESARGIMAANLAQRRAAQSASAGGGWFGGKRGGKGGGMRSPRDKTSSPPRSPLSQPPPPQ